MGGIGGNLSADGGIGGRLELGVMGKEGKPKPRWGADGNSDGPADGPSDASAKLPLEERLSR
jgi:hypothetical protein